MWTKGELVEGERRNLLPDVDTSSEDYAAARKRGKTGSGREHNVAGKPSIQQYNRS